GPLFVRGGRGAPLTDLGASFLPYARRSLELLDAGVEAARQAQAGARGRATIGVLESLSGSFLGPALAEFHASHPGVEVLARAGRRPADGYGAAHGPARDRGRLLSLDAGGRAAGSGGAAGGRGRGYAGAGAGLGPGPARRRPPARAGGACAGRGGSAAGGAAGA